MAEAPPFGGAAGGRRVRRLERTLARALHQVDELIAVAEHPGSASELRPEVSRWSPLDHAEHMAKADAASLHQLETALERDGGPPFKLVGRLVLGFGWIPRGVGKAPKPTRPGGESAEATGLGEAEAAEGLPTDGQARRRAVADALRENRRRIEALSGRLDEIARVRGRASHPFFGGLTPARWLRFLWVHHHHHLKIIRDIRTASVGR